MKLKNILIGKIGVDASNRAVSINCYKKMELREEVPIYMEFKLEENSIGIANNFKYSNGEFRGDITLFENLDLKGKMFGWGGYVKKRINFGDKKYMLKEIDFILVGITDSYNSLYTFPLMGANPNNDIILGM